MSDPDNLKDAVIDKETRSVPERRYYTDPDLSKAFLKGLGIRIFFLLLAIITFIGVTDSVCQKVMHPTWKSTHDSLQTSLIHSGIWLGGLTVVDGAVDALKSATLSPEFAASKLGKMKIGKYLQPIADILKDFNHYLMIISILLLVQLSLLKVIQLYSLKFLVGFGATACAIQYRRGTFLGNIGQLFILFGIITYFLYPLTLHFAVQGYQAQRIQAAAQFSENIGVLKEEISDVQILSTNFKKNFHLVKEITVGGIATAWQGLMSWLYGEMLICIFIPILTLVFIGFIMHQALTYMDMTAMAGLFAGGAGKLVSSLGSRTRGGFNHQDTNEQTAQFPKKQIAGQSTSDTEASGQEQNKNLREGHLEQGTIKLNSKMFYFMFLMVCLLAFFVIGCLLRFFSANARENSQDVVTHATTLFTSGHPNEVITLLRPFVQEHINNYNAYYLLGESFQDLGSLKKDKRSLYIARYYFDMAKQVATNDAERSDAEDAYLEIKVDMGNITQAASSFVKRGNIAQLLGENSKASSFFIKAGDMYLIEQNYKDACDIYQKGLSLVNQPESVLKLATAQYFDLEPKMCLKTLKNIDMKGLYPQYLDPYFLENAATILNVETDRTFTHFFFQTLSNENKDVIKKCMSDICIAKYMEPSGQNKNTAVLLARAWEMIAEHIVNLGIPTYSLPAYDAARSFYLFSGFEDDAVRMGEQYEKVDKSEPSHPLSSIACPTTHNTQQISSSIKPPSTNTNNISNHSRETLKAKFAMITTGMSKTDVIKMLGKATDIENHITGDDFIWKNQQGTSSITIKFIPGVDRVMVKSFQGK